MQAAHGTEGQRASLPGRCFLQSWGGGRQVQGQELLSLSLPPLPSVVATARTRTHPLSVSQQLPGRQSPVDTELRELGRTLCLPQIVPEKSKAVMREINALPFSLVFPRPEEAATACRGDEDLFITGQFQKTLEELDGDLEGESSPCFAIALCAGRLWGLFFLTRFVAPWGQVVREEPWSI